MPDSGPVTLATADLAWLRTLDWLGQHAGGP
jgi:hypothetical protein